MADDSARVAQRCDAAKLSLELLLDQCNLRKFPDAIFFLLKGMELKKVSLSNNQLQNITSKLGLKFASITMLDLSKNKISSIPKEFSNLINLCTIDLSENELEVFPEVLQRLPRLTTVNLSSNKIVDMRTSIYNSMQCLEMLNLEDNPLREDVRHLLQSVIRVRIFL